MEVLQGQSQIFDVKQTLSIRLALPGLTAAKLTEAVVEKLRKEDI